MALRTVGGREYGDNHADTAASLRRYGASAGEPPTAFAEARCVCGGDIFRLLLDEEQGVAVRVCAVCGKRHTICDGAEYLAGADLEDCVCLCDSPDFQITVGVSLYRESADVRWLFVGCRCVRCSLTGCYGDWSNESPDCKKLLAGV